MPVITDDLIHRRYAADSPGLPPPVHDGRSERFGCSARQETTPLSVPCCSGTSLQNLRCFTRLLARQNSTRILWFLWTSVPPTFPAMTTRRALPLFRWSSGFVSSFRLRAAWTLNITKWNGTEWCGVEWNGVEWSGVEWSGVEWSGVECVGE